MNLHLTLRALCLAGGIVEADNGLVDVRKFLLLVAGFVVELFPILLTVGGSESIDHKELSFFFLYDYTYL